MTGVFPARPYSYVANRLLKVMMRPSFPRNQWYRLMVGVLRNIACLRTCKGGIVSSDYDATTTKATARNPEPMAVATSVANLGEERVRIFEGGFIVAVLEPNESRALPMRGRLLIEAQGIAATSITITTNRRCDCGKHEEFTEEEDAEGAFLL